MTVPVRVVVADDHPMYRYGIQAVLAAAPEVQVVGEAASGRELLGLVERADPDVVLTDLAMPDLDGAAATRALLRSRPDLPVLVLTMHDDDDSVFTALRAGARGYLLKGADRAELVHAVLAVAAGQAVYGAAIARRIVEACTGAQPPTLSTPFPSLTPREREVLELLAGGRRNSEIARRLLLSDKTVRNHISAVLVKLQVPDRTAAVVKARAAGLGGPDGAPDTGPSAAR